MPGKGELLKVTELTYTKDAVIGYILGRDEDQEELEYRERFAQEYDGTLWVKFTFEDGSERDFNLADETPPPELQALLDEMQEKVGGIELNPQFEDHE